MQAESSAVMEEAEKNLNQKPTISSIKVLPLGSLEDGFLSELSQRLEAILNQPLDILQPEPEPDYALHPKRKQCFSTEILKEILKVHPSSAGKIIGITDVDLYVPGLNFVFGEAQLRGRAAVVSLARLRQSFYGLAEDGEIFFSRAAKEIVHELGHTYGLKHCRDPRCVMSFSNSIRDVDFKGEAFCQSCKLRYEKVVREGRDR